MCLAYTKCYITGGDSHVRSIAGDDEGSTPFGPLYSEPHADANLGGRPKGLGSGHLDCFQPRKQAATCEFSAFSSCYLLVFHVFS